MGAIDVRLLRVEASRWLRAACPRIGHRVAGVFLLTLLAAALPALAAVRVPEEGITREHGRDVVRRGAETLHPVRIDRRWFEAPDRAGGRWLPGTSGAPLFARTARTLAGAGGSWTWVGAVDTDLGVQSAVVTFGRDAVFAHLPQKSGAPLRIETRHGRTWLVEGTPASLPARLDEVRIPPDRKATPAASARASAKLTPASVASPSLVDVLVVYTPALVTHFGTDAAARTRIAFLESLSNQAYFDSQAGIRIRVVGMRLLDHTTPLDNDDMLSLVTDEPADPVKVQVDAWRAEVGADLVAVLRPFDHTTHTTCGIAWLGYYASPGSFAPQYGYSVSSDYPCGDRVLPHEIGHNMGLHHDTVTTGGGHGVFVYSRGHRMMLDDRTGFATVMAYTEAYQTWINLFSNPRINLCMGQPCGIVDFADNARSLTEAAPAIAAMKPTVVPVLPTLTIDDLVLAEGNSGTTLATFTVRLSQPAAGAVSFDIATSDGSAIAGQDYVARALAGQVIAAGATSRTFAVTVQGDTAMEQDETFAVALSNLSGAVANDAFAIARITNDDGPVLTIADVAVTEGNSGSRFANFTVRLSAPAAVPVTYNIRTASGTATTGSDFLAKTLTGETIAAGQVARVFSVVILGDTAVELNENFTVTATSVVGATVADGVAVGNILGDDLPALSVADVLVAEGQAGTSIATFVLKLSGPSSSPVGYSVSTGGGNATAGVDYVATSLAGQTIPAGALTRSVTVTLKGDTVVEPNETYQLTLGNVTGATVLDGVATGYLLNDDGPTLSVLDANVVEGNAGTATAIFTIRLSQAAAVPVSYSIATRNYTAVAGTDYVATSATSQVIPAGQTSRTFAVPVNGDTTAEANESFLVSVSGVSGVSTFDGVASGNVLNDDGATLSIVDASGQEGSSGSWGAYFEVKLSQAAAAPVTYTLASVNATAAAGADFTAVAATRTLLPGQTSDGVWVPFVSDGVVEQNETYYVLVTAVTGPATLLDDRALGTILNDDGPTLAIYGFDQPEGDSGTSQKTYWVNLSQPSASAVTFKVNTANASAIAGSDYVAIPLTTFSMPAGEVWLPLGVTVNGDAAVEPNEEFVLKLSAATGATILSAQAFGTILNDDGPVLTIPQASQAEGNSGTSAMTLTAQLSQPAAVPVTFRLTSYNSSATGGEDYVALDNVLYTMPAGTTSLPITITINGDTTVEGDEFVYLDVSEVTGVSNGSPYTGGTILNDD